jgi:hypothetical protein
MKTEILEYINFIKQNGRPLSQINPGSSEFALQVNDALQVLEFLKEGKIVILGGDILSEDKYNNLNYAMYIWGTEYHCLNWFCKRADYDSDAEYANRSYETAKAAIINANKVAIQLNKVCLIVLVIDDGFITDVFE